MRVAILSYGFAEYCIQQANGLARECNVLLMLPWLEAAPYAGLVDPAVECHWFNSGRLRNPIRQLAAAARLIRRIRQFGAEVLHLQQGHLWFNIALPLVRSVPLVLTVHDPRHHAGDRSSRKTPQGIMNFGFLQADRLIVHGEGLKHELNKASGIRSEKIHVVPHVALGPQTPEPANGLDDENEGRTILFFGRIWKYKGLKYLIEAETIIAQSMPDVRIVIAGEGEDFAPYRRMMGSSQRFIVHNRYISVAERDELFREASVVVLPYIEATQSGVIPLAYANSKPVVATRTGALAEAVDDGVTGTLIPPRDPAALAQAIIELLSSPERCRAMGVAGRRKLDAEWSPCAIARRLVEVYSRAIQDRAGARQTADTSPQPASNVVELSTY
jgi:glycosyltransferase involved in cell wall biosynthesis